MVWLMVLIHHGYVFMEPKHFNDGPSQLQLLDCLHVRCHSLMASRLQDMLEHAQGSNLQLILTAAVQRVLQRTPASLPWQQLQTQGAAEGSFEAVGVDGHLYSLNILDGESLISHSMVALVLTPSIRPHTCRLPTLMPLHLILLQLHHSLAISAEPHSVLTCCPAALISDLHD